MPSLPPERSGATTKDLGGKTALALFAVAVLFRLVYLLQSTANPLFSYPVVDAFYYNQWAERMAAGEWLWNEVSNYLPVYPAFLAILKIFAGNSPWVHKLAQTILGAFSAVLTAQVAARLWGRTVGMASGLLFATAWMPVLFEAEQYAESFSIFFQSLTLWILIFKGEGFRWLFPAGLVFALAAGSRANLFLAFPILCGWLLYSLREKKLRAAQAVACFAAGTLILIGPIVYRNYQLTGAPILRVQGTWSLYSGLAPEFEGLHPPCGILFMKYMRKPFQAGLRGEAEIERFWGEKLKKTLQEDPRGVALGLLRHVLIFLNAREWSQEFDVTAYRTYSSLLSLPWPGFWLFGPLGVLGLCLARPRNRNEWLFFLYTVITIASIVPFKASDRYRVPSTPLLAVFAALAAWRIVSALREKHRQRLFWMILGLSLLSALSWPDWQNLSSRKMARHDFFIGLMHESFGRPQAALAAYKRSMAKFPWDPDSPLRVGHILARDGADEAAHPFLEEALRREPEFPEAHEELSMIAERAGNLSEALAHQDKALAMYPNSRSILLRMAYIQCRQGNGVAEIEPLTRAIRETADDRLARLLTERLLAHGQYLEAISWFEKIADSPSVESGMRMQARMQAGLTAARFLRDEAQARYSWRKALVEFPAQTFFAVQARYMLGEIGDAELEEAIRSHPVLAVSGRYIMGLRAWLAGDTQTARRHYEACLEGEEAKDPPEKAIPRQWAREDLRLLSGVRLEALDLSTETACRTLLD